MKFCGCGHGIATHPYKNLQGLRVHELGKGNCCRKLATGSLIPSNFRIVNGMKVCDVNGYTITEYTLFEQRLYSKHEDGSWSLPKDEKSVNSLDIF